MSNFWKELFKLRCFASKNPKTWFHFLHLVEYWFNTTYHSTIGMSPFQALYGRPPPSLLNYIDGSTASDTISTTIKEMLSSLWANSCGYTSMHTNNSPCNDDRSTNSWRSISAPSASHAKSVLWRTSSICQRRAVYIQYFMSRFFVPIKVEKPGEWTQHERNPHLFVSQFGWEQYSPHKYRWFETTKPQFSTW